MKLLPIVLLVFATSASFARKNCTADTFIREVSEGMPDGSEAIIRRIVECNHWSAETGDNSAERKKQVEEGVKKAKCDTLEKDRAEFLKKNPPMKDVLLKADDWEGQCD